MLGVHNYLHCLLVDARTPWPRPEGMIDVAVVRPRIRMTGWSGAPQVSGRGMAHVLHAIAYGTYKAERVGLAHWVCGGRTTYPVLGDPTPSQEVCERCSKLG